MSYFTNKVFLVTGASSGIGLAIAHALVRSGAKVALMARNEATLAGLVTTWNAPERTLAVPGDVTHEDDCRRAVAATVAAYGRLDGLVHSAGISMRGAIADTKPDVFRQLMETNFMSCVHLAQAALPALNASRGHFVAISSVVGKFSPPGRGGYAASKHAVQAFMDALRIESADAGVHVMTVCPGFVATNISLNALTADGSRHAVMDADTAGGLNPDDVAQTVLAGIKNRAREIAPTGRLEGLGLVFARWAPALLDRMLLRRLHAQERRVLAADEGHASS